MTSIDDTEFMMKYNFYEKNIKQYERIKIITIIGNSCLVESIKTHNINWVMRWDIYPINNKNMGNFWEYNKIFEEMIKNV
jgi:hypothetical protein